MFRYLCDRFMCLTVSNASMWALMNPSNAPRMASLIFRQPHTFQRYTGTSFYNTIVATNNNRSTGYGIKQGTIKAFCHSASSSTPTRQVQMDTENSLQVNQSTTTGSDEQNGNESWIEIGDLEEDHATPDYFEGISLERGKTGVFDVEDLVSILNREKVDSIVVIAVPAQLQYVDYLVIGSGRSPRQMSSVTDFIRRIYKRRKNPSDRIPDIEGQKNQDWIAMDLGNIALHIFSRSARKVYDLETLWTCGHKYDDKCNQDEEEEFSVIFEKASANIIRFPDRQQQTPTLKNNHV